MRALNKKPIDSQLANTDVFSTAFNTDQTFACSAQLQVVGAVLGNFKIQCSDDPIKDGFPQNWMDVQETAIAITGAGLYIIRRTEICSQYHRLAFIDTSSSTNTGTITGTFFTHGF